MMPIIHIMIFVITDHRNISIGGSMKGVEATRALEHMWNTHCVS